LHHILLFQMNTLETPTHTPVDSLMTPEFLVEIPVAYQGAPTDIFSAPGYIVNFFDADDTSNPHTKMSVSSLLETPLLPPISSKEVQDLAARVNEIYKETGRAVYHYCDNVSHYTSQGDEISSRALFTISEEDKKDFPCLLLVDKKDSEDMIKAGKSGTIKIQIGALQEETETPFESVVLPHVINLCQEFLKSSLEKTQDEDGDPIWTLDHPVSLFQANELCAFLKSQLESGGFALVDNDYWFSINFVSTEIHDAIEAPLDTAFGFGFKMTSAHTA